MVTRVAAVSQGWIFNQILKLENVNEYVLLVPRNRDSRNCQFATGGRESALSVKCGLALILMGLNGSSS